MSTTTQTYWQSSAEIWEGQRNYSLKNELHKDAISCFSIRKDWGFAVRAKSFALHWRSRGFFRGHVRSCEKGLCLHGSQHRVCRKSVDGVNGAVAPGDHMRSYELQTHISSTEYLLPRKLKTRKMTESVSSMCRGRHANLLLTN